MRALKYFYLISMIIAASTSQAVENNDCYIRTSSFETLSPYNQSIQFTVMKYQCRSWGDVNKLVTIYCRGNQTRNLSECLKHQVRFNELTASALESDLGLNSDRNHTRFTQGRMQVQ